MHNEALKYGGLAASQSLTNLFNTILHLEITPSIWAKASVHLVYKGNDADTLAAESYRPISLTSNVMKVFERLIYNRFTTHFESTSALPDEQAGFRSGRSCTDQIYILRKILDSASANKRATCACFIDLKQAFPSTWRDAIWHRLRELSRYRGQNVPHLAVTLYE